LFPLQSQDFLISGKISSLFPTITPDEDAGKRMLAGIRISRPANPSELGLGHSDNGISAVARYKFVQRLGETSLLPKQNI
ncbi:hypothetical protein, partial [Paenibacillus sonchi]|uniref:hypothetical protein n=1 Tax=Paenibacillus sonchi TaxID=373687 RepID=UPI001ADFBDDA